jgi:hypothetical protein
MLGQLQLVGGGGGGAVDVECHCLSVDIDYSLGAPAAHSSRNISLLDATTTTRCYHFTTTQR